MTITQPEKCVGCGACRQICPKNAITMTADAEGFLRPGIDSEKCVECGLCQKVCPAETPTLLEGERSAYALKHNDEAVRSRCTSGGAFIAISDAVLAQGGIVYGVIYDENFRAVHTRAENPRQRDEMCGSKYVQSDPLDTCRQVADDLKNGKTVLYSGTSCQIDGLNHYLRCKNVPSESLTTVGLICHGVPSPKLWQDHIQNIQAKRRKILRYENRAKVRGWHEHNECITYADGKREFYTKLSQNHKDLFYGHYIIRPSCSVCPYAADPAAADITIADFWGVQYVMPQIDDNRGISLVLCNSQKGNALVQSAQNVTLWDVDRDIALSHNHTKPCKPNPRRKEFWADYEAHGYHFVCAKYASDSFLGRIRYGGKKRLRALLVKLKLKPV